MWFDEVAQEARPDAGAVSPRQEPRLYVLGRPPSSARPATLPRGERYRRFLARRVQEAKRQPKPADVVRAEQIVQHYRRVEAKLIEIEGRLNLKVPSDLACPACFYKHGDVFLLRFRGSRETSQVEAAYCPTCGYVDAPAP